MPWPAKKNNDLLEPGELDDGASGLGGAKPEGMLSDSGGGGGGGGTGDIPCPG